MTKAVVDLGRSLRRHLAVAALGLAVALTARAHAAEIAPLAVATWGGAYETTQQAVVFAPFTTRTGVVIETRPLDGTLDPLKKAVTGEGPALHVVDLPGADAEAACAAGLTDPPSAAVLAKITDGTAGVSDFIAAPGPCGVPATLAAEVVVYDRQVFTAQTPASARDLFDTERFPGKRALKRAAQGTLEWALLADGVPVRDVGATLATTAGQDRAFARLDKLRSQIVWWDRGDAPLGLLERREVVMAAMYGARAYQAIAGIQTHYDIVWPGALITDNRWVLVKGAGTNEAAQEFLKFATDTQRQSDLVLRLPYGPARRSALTALTPEMRAFSPSVPEHLSEAILIDAKFWATDGQGLEQRFEAWLAAAP